MYSKLRGIRDRSLLAISRPLHQFQATVYGLGIGIDSDLRHLVFIAKNKAGILRSLA